MTTVIGLTGGIASGKSVVSRMLAERGALVMDADKLGNEAYAPESACDEGVPVVVLEAAVLIEADWTPLVDQVWVVTVPPLMARDRIISRNGLTPEQADQRIGAQLSNDERAKHADVVIDNSGTLEELERRVHEHWERLTAAPGRKA